MLSAVKNGESSEAKAIKRLARSPHWVWVAMDPVTKLLVALDVGERTLAMTQRFVHHVAQVLAPDCAPLFVTDGFREYATACPRGPSQRGCEQAAGVGSSKEGWLAQAPCVHTTGVEDVTRGERATGRLGALSFLGLFALVTADG